jgi:cytochrome c2
MPSSLRWLALLFAASVFAAVASGGVMYAETRSRTRTMAEQISGGSVTAGKTAVAAYGCGSCHVIPGISGATGAVGPPLAGVATRAQIAGHLPNDPRSMQRWLMHPQGVAPGNGMPDMGVPATDARDMAAYLYTLK